MIAPAIVQLELFGANGCAASDPDRPPLVFIGMCWRCGSAMEPAPAEGPGESWKAAEQWTYLAIQQHLTEVCPGITPQGGKP